MNSFEIPPQLFMCPQCKTKLDIDINTKKIICPSCKKEVVRDGRMLDFSLLTPRLNLQFGDYLSGLYNFAGQKQTVSDNWRIKKISEKLPKKDIRSICLEIGGADGPITPILEGKYSVVCSIDFSKTCLQRIKSKTKKTLCLFGDGQFLPFLDNSVDVVICTEVLEHVLVPTQLVLEIRRVLKKDGDCLLSVPNETTGLFPATINPNQIIAHDAHLNFYDSVHLKTFLFRMGFAIQEIQTIRAPFTWKQIINLPIRFLRVGSISTHILCSIKPKNNPDDYWQSLEKTIDNT